MYTWGRKFIQTNQYAVTEQSKSIDDRMIPGIFVKYDIEPILLTVSEHRQGMLSFLIRIVNVLSGVLVAAHWGYTLTEWTREAIGKKRRGETTGFLGTGKGAYDD